MRPTAALPGVVVGHALLLRPVDLHIGGVQVDGHLHRQRRLAFGGEQIEGPLREVSKGGLESGQMVRPEPAANPAAVVEASTGTADSSAAATSAR